MYHAPHAARTPAAHHCARSRCITNRPPTLLHSPAFASCFLTHSARSHSRRSPPPPHRSLSPPPPSPPPVSSGRRLPRPRDQRLCLSLRPARQAFGAPREGLGLHGRCGLLSVRGFRRHVNFRHCHEVPRINPARLWDQADLSASPPASTVSSRAGSSSEAARSAGSDPAYASKSGTPARRLPGRLRRRPLARSHEKVGGWRGSLAAGPKPCSATGLPRACGKSARLRCSR